MNDKNTRPTSRDVTVGLLDRYDQPGPRYTSYPTAVEFHTDIDDKVYEQRLAKANQSSDPLSIYVHLPFCQHRCLFCGCHVIITPHYEKAMPYLDLLEREIELVSAHLPDRRGIMQLHLGGGTPTYYNPDELARFLDKLLDPFDILPGAELAVECDPRVTTSEQLDVLASKGFNRISFGVQDFTPEVQEAIERVQSVEQTQSLLEHARSKGYGGINIDLIYGLPFQQPDSFEQSCETVIGLRPDRVALYSFAFVPWIRGHMKKLDESDFPGREVKFSLFALAREKFLSAGYEPIGMDHFALPEDELAKARVDRRLKRNFQGYTVLPAPEVLGLGISAIGDMAGAFIQNSKKLSTYTEAIEAGRLPVERGFARNEDDEIRRVVIAELMCNFGLAKSLVEDRFGIVFDEYFAEDLGRLQPHQNEGLVEVANGRIDATPRGELFIRNLAMAFDKYWWETHKDSENPIFSRTV